MTNTYTYGSLTPRLLLNTWCPTPNSTGKERDSESGLDNFGARYYSSGYGRFAGPDAPFADWSQDDPQSWNLYGYARNNPLNFTDADGRACVQKEDGTVADDNSGGQSCKDAAEPQKVEVKAQDPDALPLSARIIFSDVNRRPILQFAGAVYAGGAVVGATGGTACYLICGSVGVGTITTVGVTTAGTAGPAATDPRLQNFVNMLFQASDKVPGGTAGAVRYELATGEPVGGFFHSEKAETIINGLNNLLKSGTLSLHDQQLAKSLMLDLQNALARK